MHQTIATKLLRGFIAGMWSIIFAWYLRFIVDHARRIEDVAEGALDAFGAVEAVMK